MTDFAWISCAIPPVGQYVGFSDRPDEVEQALQVSPQSVRTLFIVNSISRLHELCNICSAELNVKNPHGFVDFTP